MQAPMPPQAPGAPRHERSSPCPRPWRPQATRRDEAFATPRPSRIAPRRVPARGSRQQVRDRLEQALRHLVGGSGSVDQADALRLLDSDQAEGGLNLAVILARAPADAVGFIAIAFQRPILSFVEEQDERSIGKTVSDAKGVDCADCLYAEAAGATLICERAVDEAVGQHPAPFVERRTDRLFHMIGPRGGKQQGFRLRSPPRFLALQEQLSHCLSTAAPAWFARDETADAARLERRGERFDLRGLADPFPAFEADEASTFCPFGAHAMPSSCLRPIQMRPKKPALPTSSPATRGTTCGGVSPVVMTSSAISWPLAIGAV